MQWWLWEGTRSKVDKDQMSLLGNEEGVVYRK